MCASVTQKSCGENKFQNQMSLLHQMGVKGEQIQEWYYYVYKYGMWVDNANTKG